jgi:hypothetical protein
LLPDLSKVLLIDYRAVMAPFTWQKRSHSFPPALSYAQGNPSFAKDLGPPLPDIDDEPFLHFLAEEDDYEDYLHLSENRAPKHNSSGMKAEKFKRHKSSETLRHHHLHGSYSRRPRAHHRWETAGGYFDYPSTESSPSVYVSHTTDAQAVAIPRPRRRSHRTLSVQRHSWQEPSLDLFTLDEEIPQIVVSDYDNTDHELYASTTLSSSLSADVDGDAKPVQDITAAEEAGQQSPHLAALLPTDKPDVELRQMWFAERARL